MNALFRMVLATAATAFCAQAMAEVTFYEREGFRGRSFTTDRPVENLVRFGFNDRASSIVVAGESWEVCDDDRFGGRCVVLLPGRYATLSALGLGNRLSSTRAVAIVSPDDLRRAGPAADAAQITFYEHDGFAGRSFTVDKTIENFASYGFNDRASSAVVVGEPWQICSNARFGGRCIVLRPGRYPSMSSMGLNDRVSSARMVGENSRVDDNRYAPAPVPAYDFRRRDNERIYEANVTSVRAVVGPPEQRCWVEREQLAQPGGGANVPGAIAGAIIGGILGHQIGGGRGRDLATAGGAVAGAAVGANVGRDGNEQQGNYQEVQRCKSVPSQARAELWDVTYNFRGTEHRIQMTADPGRTVTVNERGEPRD